MRRPTFIAIALLAFSQSPSFSESITIKPGETLSEIAERYSVPLRALMVENNLNNSDQIWSGQTLTLPNSIAKNIKKKTHDHIKHTVKSGETLGTIAIKYKINPELIVLANKLQDADFLHIGQELIIPQKRIQQESLLSENIHTVKNGESLSSISRKYDISINTLLKINSIGNGNHLEPGQKIKLPINAVKENKTPGIEFNKRDSYENFHIIKKGENLSAISSLYNIPISTLLKINTIPNPDKISTGTKLNLSPSEINKGNLSSTKKVAYVGPEWRKYGPLKVNWLKWKEMGGSYVTTSINSQEKSFYIALNCNFKKINFTGKNGDWRTWLSPLDNFEHNLINDFCIKEKGLS